MHDLPPSAHVIIQAAPPIAMILGGIVRFPPDQRDLSFNDLTCTDQDRAKLYELISTIAAKNWLDLLVVRSHMKQLGAEINHVHPLKFLATIFADPHLKTCMPQIWNDFLKRDYMINELGANLTRESDKGTLDKHLPAFSQQLNLSLDTVRSYTGVRDWDGLVRHLNAQAMGAAR